MSRRRSEKSSFMSAVYLVHDFSATVGSKRGYHAPNSAGTHAVIIMSNQGKPHHHQDALSALYCNAQCPLSSCSDMCL